MSENKAETMTTVVGYFNAQKFPIFIEISEINLKAELAPNAYIRDRQGRFINDPIFEPYCHQRGLSRAVSKQPVPINYVPRFMKVERPPATVTQASGFVRQSDGRTVPTYSAVPQPPKETAANKNPIHGMSIEDARKAGLIGRPRLVPEDYGAEETTGAPSKSTALPDIKYSIESAPKVKTSQALPPELLEATDDLSPEQRAQRAQLQKSLAQSSATPTGDDFNPARVTPTRVVPAASPALPESSQAQPVQPAATKPKAKAAAVRVTPESKSATPRRRIAAPVKPEPVEKIEQVEETAVEEVTEETQPVTPGSGIVEPLNGDSLPAPNLDEPAPAEDGKRFICAADGNRFSYRSQLERHVKRNFPDMADALMAAYPPQ